MPAGQGISSPVDKHAKTIVSPPLQPVRFFLFSFIPATFWVVIGYFVLFTSTKAEGAIQTFGRSLAIWIFVIAALLPAAGAYVTFADLCPIEGMFQAMHSGTGP